MVDLEILVLLGESVGHGGKRREVPVSTKRESWQGGKKKRIPQNFLLRVLNEPAKTAPTTPHCRNPAWYASPLKARLSKEAAVRGALPEKITKEFEKSLLQQISTALSTAVGPSCLHDATVVFPALE